MMLDKKSVDLLLRLGDDQLVAIIKKLASDAGVNVSGINPSKEQIAGIRQALSLATDEDLKRAADLLQSFENTQSNK